MLNVNEKISLIITVRENVSESVKMKVIKISVCLVGVLDWIFLLTTTARMYQLLLLFSFFNLFFNTFLFILPGISLLM